MTDAATLHRTSFVIDGLQCCNWSRAIFEEARAGGVDCINAANLLWQNFRGGLDYINFWKEHFRDNADLIMPVRTVADIRRAKETGPHRHNHHRLAEYLADRGSAEQHRDLQGPRGRHHAVDLQYPELFRLPVISKPQ